MYEGEPLADDDTKSAEEGSADQPRGDYLVRAMGLGASVRALAITTTGVSAELMRLHGSLPTSASAVSRLATACLLLGGTVKGREQVGIEVRCEGPLQGMYGVADAHGNVRVTVDQPYVDLAPRADGRIDLPRAVGKGLLVVTKNLGMKEPYTGLVPLVHGGIALDMVEYFRASEQKPAAMGLGEIVDHETVHAAGGFLLQVFPNADEHALEELERRVAMLPPVSRLVRDGVTPEEMLRQLLPDLQILERYPVQFRCTCSLERFERILITLGADELATMVEEQERTELQCHYCNHTYAIERDQLRHLLVIARDGVN